MRLRKRRGVFYTPARLAELLAAWSVRSKDDFVLEPSFGGCGLIAALQKRFIDIGNRTPLKNIFGCDVDPAAFTRHLPGAVGREFDKTHFRKADFLSLDNDAFSVAHFSAVVGNPPYVSYHNMFRTQRLAASLVGSDSEFRLSGMASLWAYFVFHSLRFLKKNGRMAWLLPGSLLHADYAKEFLHELARRFVRVAVISLGERIFLADGVSETTEILLCDGHHKAWSQREVEVTQAGTIDDCAKFLDGWRTNDWKGTSLNGRAIPALVGAKELSTFEEINASPDVVNFETLASISIGIVTGANRLFILNEDSAWKHGLPLTALKPILAKFSASPGICLLPGDLISAIERGLPVLLVDGAKATRCRAVQTYFDAVPQAFREKNVTFSKHADWRCPDDNRIPDAFFPYMYHIGPRLILNDVRVNATNTIHRVYFKADLDDAKRKLIALSLLSTFSQLSAEIEGRSYGAGVLKHEPGEVRKIRLILPKLAAGKIESLFDRVDSLLRRHLAYQATHVVDRELFAAMHQPPTLRKWKSLRMTLKQLRARRHKRRVTI
jgi:adenine-specific DNA-methyltransferase